MDLYVDMKKRVWIIDFNPFGNPTSSLLFEWEELVCIMDNDNNDHSNLENKDLVVCNMENNCCYNKNNNLSNLTNNELVSNAIEFNHNNSTLTIPNNNNEFEFRLIESPQDIIPNGLGSARGPIDVTLAPDFHKFMEICKIQKNEENDA